MQIISIYQKMTEKFIENVYTQMHWKELTESEQAQFNEAYDRNKDLD